MRLLYIKYPICQTLSSKLSWSHYCELLTVSDDDKRSFYEHRYDIFIRSSDNYAIWSSRITSKDANRQIAELKQLSKIQIETNIKQLEAEIQKMMVKIKKVDNGCQGIDDINKGARQLGGAYRNIMMRRHQENKALRELQIYSECFHYLNEILMELKDLKNKFG